MHLSIVTLRGNLRKRLEAWFEQGDEFETIANADYERGLMLESLEPIGRSRRQFHRHKFRHSQSFRKDCRRYPARAPIRESIRRRHRN
jgi:hypothetical protein